MEDPTGKEDEEFLKVINSIEEKVRKLKETLRRGYFLQLDIDMLIKQDIFMYSVGKILKKNEFSSFSAMIKEWQMKI